MPPLSLCINRHELLESTASIGDKDNNEDDNGDDGDYNSDDGDYNNHHATRKRKGLGVFEIDGNVFPSDIVVDHDGRGGMELSQVYGMISSPAHMGYNTSPGFGAGAASVADPTADTVDIATAASARTGNSLTSDIARPPKKSKRNNGSKKKKSPPISDSDLEKRVNQVRDISGGGNIVDSLLRNIVDSSLRLTTTNDNEEDDDNKEVEGGTKYITMPVSCGKKSPWWVGFELFNPVKHPTLYKQHVMCKECSIFKNNPDAGIIKVGLSQSTSNLRSHKKHHHSAEYETIIKGASKKTTMQSNGGLIHTSSILNMPGFTAKVKAKDAKLLFQTAATCIDSESSTMQSQMVHMQSQFGLVVSHLMQLSTAVAQLAQQQQQQSSQDLENEKLRRKISQLEAMLINSPVAKESQK